ncbi:hydroxymethylpyrimidine/phosphomethylpyrimidine kinase [Phaeobacter sp. A36a-5a]|uniref:bifunctional hydroxymethylpyrimidine kinase/phosphomethylpyrimidine kinase n=1 Tax=Phaeobacter bryozoorum TaxID=1086632 RepID=UPI0030C8FAF3
MSALLIIAGTDSSGGAGLTRDIAAATAMARMIPQFAARSLSLRPVVTAVTVQTNQALQEIYPTPVDGILGQIQAAVETGPISAVKIGMVGSAAAAEAIAATLARLLPPSCAVVLDPVLRSSSGGRLMHAGDLAPLMARADLITPNLHEASQLCPGLHGAVPGGGSRFDPQHFGMAAQARQLHQAGAGAVLIKGGHGTDAMAVDHLFCDATHVAFPRPRLKQTKRGTGCTLATAIAVQLMAAQKIETACRAAGDYVHEWLKEIPA